MATSHTLKAEQRTITGTGKLNQLRVEGWVPAVIYSADSTPMNIQVNAKEFATMLANSTSEHFLVNLEIASVGSKLVLLKDVQHNALSLTHVHADFQEISENTQIHATVPVRIKGEAAGVKLGGNLNHLIHDLEVRCLSKDLPDVIEVDVTSLGVAETITVKELPIAAGVVPTLGGDVIVCIVAETAASKSLNA